MASGERLGRYRLLKSLGRGGMGEVWLARTTGAHGVQKTVAIKRILPVRNEDDALRRFVDEARTQLLVNHPNVVQVIEVGEEDGDTFIVLEHVAGHSLSELVKRVAASGAKLDAYDAVFIVMQALDGLHAAHVQRLPDGEPARIVHRDVSPQNILVTYDGIVKVIDFGIARSEGRREQSQVVRVAGKPGYMAPEQLVPDKLAPGEVLDARVDVFAAGIVLHELVAGRKLFAALAPLKLVEAILHGEVPDLHVEGACDEELWAVIRRALSTERDDRFPDAAAFAGALRGWLYRRDAEYSAARLARWMDLFAAEKRELALALISEGDVVAAAGAGAPELTLDTIDAIIFGKHGAFVEPKTETATSFHERRGGDALTRRDRPARAAPAPARSRKMVVVGAAVLATFGALAWGLSSPRAVVDAGAPVPAAVPAVVAAAPVVLVIDGGVDGAVDPADPGARRTAPPSSVRRPAPRRVEATGTGVLVLTAPEGTWPEVWIDGVLTDDRPPIRVELPVGPHAVRVHRVDGAKDERFTVEVRAGETTRRRIGER